MLCMDLALLNRFFPPHLLPCAQPQLSKKYMRNSTPPNMLDMNIFSIYLYRKLSYLVHVSNLLAGQALRQIANARLRFSK